MYFLTEKVSGNQEKAYLCSVKMKAEAAQIASVLTKRGLASVLGFLTESNCYNNIIKSKGISKIRVKR